MESKYIPDNHYHNNTHAADVVQSTHALLCLGGIHYCSQPLDTYSILIAAVVHDVGHPGFNNVFQINSHSDSAILHNDHSPLENMHLSIAFQQLLGKKRDQSLDILAGLSPEQVESSRSLIIAAVLETDNNQHFACLKKINDLTEVLIPKEGIDLGKLPLAIDPSRWLEVDDGDPALQVLRFILHLADISSQAKPAPLFTRWSNGVLEEFFSQGDEEKKRGMPVTFLCDRETTLRAQSQKGFIQFIVKPAYELLGRLIPKVAESVLPVLEANLEHWEIQSEKEEKEIEEKKLKEILEKASKDKKTELDQKQ